MDRKEFLSIVGLGAASLLYQSCLSGCTTNDTGVNAPTNVDFTLDLSSSSNSALTRDGGYLYNNGVIVARVSAGNFIAVSAACTHQGTSVVYQSSGSQFYCPSHGSRFSSSGSVVQGPAGSPLHKYNATLTGTSLRVYS
jgi:cytochrome b6-f complex iron-sulfur subunit